MMYTDEKGAPVLTVRGSNYEECKKKLWEKYGNDYQTISRRPILHGGFLGLFQKEEIEVTYQVRPRELQVKTNTNVLNSSNIESKNFDFQKARDELLKATAGTTVDSVKQMASLKESMESINKKLEQITSGTPNKHPSVSKIEEMLESNEFTFSYISGISKRLVSEFSLEKLDDFDLVERAVVDWIGESISIQPVKTFRPPHVIILVGPTGVGKTTTIAKLAANIILDAKEKGICRPELRFVSIDRIRVGAMEQLVHYGEIMNVPIDKAENASDVKTIYNDYRDRVDAFLIDTSGFSPNDSSNIGQMRAILDLDELRADVSLAISATTKARDLQNIIQNYEPFGFKSVIVTKCDETKQYGNIISVLHEKHKCISYITDGQRVPRNIRRADVIDFLIGLNDFKIDRVHIEDKFGAK